MRLPVETIHSINVRHSTTVPFSYWKEHIIAYSNIADVELIFYLKISCSWYDMINFFSLLSSYFFIRIKINYLRNAYKEGTMLFQGQVIRKPSYGPVFAVPWDPFPGSRVLARSNVHEEFHSSTKKCNVLDNLYFSVFCKIVPYVRDDIATSNNATLSKLFLQKKKEKKKNHISTRTEVLSSLNSTSWDFNLQICF